MRGLRVEFRGLAPVDGVSFTIQAGEVVGLLGESGSGKTTLALALLGLSGGLARGSVLWRGREMLTLDEREWRGIRGAQAAMVWQEPALALNPVLRAGTQVAEVLRAHRPWSWRRCREEAARRLEEVFPEGDAERIARAFPHQLSGGQRQRVAIAQALACDPALLVADEPTSALDAVTQAEILALLARLRERRGLAILLIAHNPGVLAGLASRVMVMYAGRIVEQGEWQDVMTAPRHPYTRALLGCMAAPDSRGRLGVIEGAPPDPAERAPGCRFEPRCPERMAACAVSAPPAGPVECIRHAG